MKVKEILITCPRISPNDLASKARTLMRKNKLRALPVFDGEKLVGIITRSDLLKITSNKSNITVGGLLWRPLIKVDADASLNETIDILLKNGIKQVPVFEKGEYLGLVRDVDLLKALINKSTPSKKVKDVMTKGVHTFSVDDPVSKIWARILTHSGFPILDKGEVVGIVTSKELLESKKARFAREADKVKSVPKIETIMRITTGNEKKLAITPTESVLEASKKILEADVSILPVVNKKGVLEGIVTKKDLLRGFRK